MVVKVENWDSVQIMSDELVCLTTMNYEAKNLLACTINPLTRHFHYALSQFY